jgi:hypothetical protein
MHTHTHTVIQIKINAIKKIKNNRTRVVIYMFRLVRGGEKISSHSASEREHFI